MEKSFQSRVASSISQEINTIIIAGEEFRYPPLTARTLFMLSKYISKESEEFKGTTASDVIALATENDALSSVLATLILGSKYIKQEIPEIIEFEEEISEYNAETKYWLGFIPHIIKTPIKRKEIKYKETGKTVFDALVNRFAEDFAISDVVTAIETILNTNKEIGFFLRGLITLKEVSLTTPTKEIEATAPGA